MEQRAARFMDAESYHAIATGPFAPLYPYYAGEIMTRTGVNRGCCLDVGCGGGHLGLALAERSGMALVLVDQSPQMVERARSNALERHLPTPVWVMQGEVQALPLPDDSIDLVVSRGSIPFWEKLPQAFREIQRVLKPGGHAYVGGGLGTPEMRQQIMRQMRERDPNWVNGERSNIPRHPEGYYEDALREAGIAGEVLRGENGTWVWFRKTKSGQHS